MSGIDTELAVLPRRCRQCVPSAFGNFAPDCTAPYSMFIVPVVGTSNIAKAVTVNAAFTLERSNLSLSELRGHFKLVLSHLSGTRFPCIWHLFLMAVFCFHLLLMIYVPFELFSSPVKSRFLYSYHRPFYRYAIASFLCAFCSYACRLHSSISFQFESSRRCFLSYPVSRSRGSNSTTKQVIFSDWSRYKEKRSEPYYNKFTVKSTGYKELFVVNNQSM